jgi:serine/threonine-protein kinase
VDELASLGSLEADFANTLRDAGLSPDHLTLDDNGTLMTRRGASGPKGIDLPALDDAHLKVIDRLGKGGQGVVDRAMQVPLVREVAVKRSEENSELVVEGRVIGHLEHPNVVPVYALGADENGEVLLVMKRIEGRSWKDLILSEELELEQHLRILNDVCRAAHFAHERGVLHRDLKPGNIMVGAFGETYVLDWGIAAALDDLAPEGLPPSRTTILCGTPGYMAPEMCTPGADLDRRADIYALGAMLYRLLTGHRPHRSTSVVKHLAKTIAATDADPGEDVAPELRTICRRATAAKPADRYATAEEFRRALEDYTEHASTLRLCERAWSKLEDLAQVTDDDEGDAAATRAYYESRFGFEQALKEVPDLEVAALGLAQAHEQMARHEIARGRLEVAERAAAHLEEIPEDLASQLHEARASRDAIEKKALAHDEHEGESARAAGIVATGVVCALIAGAIEVGFHQLEWELKVWHCFVAMAIMFVFVVLDVTVRGAFKRNLANRQIAMMGLAMNASLTAGLGFAALADIEIGTAFAYLDLTVALGTAGVALVDRRFIVNVVVFALAAPASFFLPAPLTINGVAGMLGLFGIAWWIRRGVKA